MFKHKIIVAMIALSYILFIQIIDGKASKIPIEVEDTCHDKTIGRKLVYQIKDKIKGSNLFSLSDSHGKRIKLIIITIDYPSKELFNISDVATIYCVSWVFFPKDSGLPLYLSSYVGWCGEKRIKDEAELLLAETDKVISNIFVKWNN